jgi:hypothetical protein
MKEFHAFEEIRRFPATFIAACRWSQSCVTFFQSTPHHSVSTTSISILSSHTKLGLPSCLFMPGFPADTQHEFVFFPLCTTCFAQLFGAYVINGIIFLNSANNEISHYTVFSTLLLLPPSITYSPQNIFLFRAPLGIPSLNMGVCLLGFCYCAAVITNYHIVIYIMTL